MSGTTGRPTIQPVLAMPIKISKTLIKKLPPSEQADIEQKLKTKSAGQCHLCEVAFNYASDKIVADHDVPEDAGGGTTIANLNLTHSDCNSFKRNHPTVLVRPYLRFLQFLRGSNGQVNYDGCLPHFEIVPQESEISVQGDELHIDFADGTSGVFLIREEGIGSEGESTRVAYVDVPRVALYNDDKCQPRSIRPGHVWSIFSDLAMNPLHEAPGCRLKSGAPSAKGAADQLWMFDGQHKTVAAWLHGRERITVKLYLDLGRESAVQLVNSIQAKIKKLPLSPFELSSKMSEEWQDRFNAYEEQVGTDHASESGFMEWVPKDEKRRAKSAFQDALFQSVLDREDFAFKAHIVAPGEKKKSSQITQATFRNKLLKPLLHLDPLDETLEEGGRLRSREVDNIVSVLNELEGRLFTGSDAGGGRTEKEERRLHRALYQSSLQLLSKLLRESIQRVLVTSPPRELIEKPLKSKSLQELGAYMGRMLAHPVWAEPDLNRTSKLTAIDDALKKNQDAKKAFERIGLRMGYIVGVDDLEQDVLED